MQTNLNGRSRLPFFLNLTGEYHDYTKPNQNSINPRRGGNGRPDVRFGECGEHVCQPY
jgi:hypothetical protein